MALLGQPGPYETNRNLSIVSDFSLHIFYTFTSIVAYTDAKKDLKKEYFFFVIYVDLMKKSLQESRNLFENVRY